MDDARVRFALVGGFLGAGKTSMMCRLGAQLGAEGERVALITNDQAGDLVDSNYARGLGLPVEEIAGGCFCCRFADLAKACEQILTHIQPTIILAEPVGSCADLSATVLAPLRRFYGDRLTLAPYTVLVAPDRLAELSRPELVDSPMGYLFFKQLEEADIVALNKVDLLKSEARAQLRALLAARLPATPAVSVSARDGQGVAEWWARLSADSVAGQHILEIDYDTYAEAEAELGWLNATVALRAAAPFAAETFLADLLAELRRVAQANVAPIGHIKALVESDGGSCRANLTGLGQPVEVAGALSTASARLTLNCRVAMAPEDLEAASVRALRRVGNQLGVGFEVQRLQSFRPGRPTPTHRFTAP
ncbi:MAG: cobalamin biosynthesis protein P47K [Armatimonadetes bacterium]|nr:cobalamin biosynthesis protein P47K [Armatimonadota bacterium]